MNPCARETGRPLDLEPPPAGLYVHVPFCAGKCAYCDFYSVPVSPEGIARWLRAVAAEASLHAGIFSGFDTCYLGGGTPSVLSVQELGTLLETLRGHGRLVPDAEITLEANPDDVTPDKLRRWRDLGINRVSLGVQSLEDGSLKLLGRRHNAGQAVRAMEAVRDAGFDSWSADLIFGLPGQTPGAWEGELERLLSFLPDHVSCYQLTLAPGTPLQRLLECGRLTMPGEEEERGLFLAASRRLEDHGYVHYEVSNFCKRLDSGESGNVRAAGTRVPEDLSRACRHNLKYWGRRPYLGVGPSAHSFQGNERWWNPRSLDRYCEALETGHPPEEGRETLTPEQERMEAVSLAFRTRGGIARHELLSFPGAGAPLARLLQEGLLEEAGDRVVPTRQGFLVADRLALPFL